MNPNVIQIGVLHLIYFIVIVLKFRKIIGKRNKFHVGRASQLHVLEIERTMCCSRVIVYVANVIGTAMSINKLSTLSPCLV